MDQQPPRRNSGGETYYFEQLSAEEKRRVIAALSMGKLSEAEKQQLARACAQSQLTETEKKQLTRAFTLSKLTDDERRALLQKKQAQKAAQQSVLPEEVPVAPVQNTELDEKQQLAPVPKEQRLSVKDASVPEEEDFTRTRKMTAAVSNVSQTVRENAIRDITPKKLREKESSRGQDDHDNTALTSMLKGVVYIVAVLIVSIFASWAIISVGNDVFAFVKNDEVVSVVISEDMTVKDVAHTLYENGVIRYPTIYELFIRLKKYSTNYLVGEYEISPTMNYKELNRTFTYIENTRTQVVVPIPEGYTIDQMIELFVSYGLGTKDAFVDVINNYVYEDFRFIDALPTLDAERKYRLEGYLFPDTYYFFTDSSVDPANTDSEVAVIYKLLQNFQRKVTDAYYDRAQEMGMTMDQVITLASMLQAEGTTKSDFENISSVFHNRLDHAREYPLLQSDATLQYILDKRKTALSAADLQIDSKYNSYMYPGLPPSAICNPGLDAIDCALYPATTNYYYFLADSRGNTYFSETLEEHEKLKAEHIG